MDIYMGKAFDVWRCVSGEANDEGLVSTLYRSFGNRGRKCSAARYDADAGPGRSLLQMSIKPLTVSNMRIGRSSAYHAWLRGTQKDRSALALMKSTMR